MSRKCAGLVGLLLLLSTAAGAAEPAPSEQVVGLSLSGRHKAYRLAAFSDAPALNDEIAHLAVVVFYDRENDRAAAFFRLVAGEALEFSGQAAGSLADDLGTLTRWDMNSGKAVSGNLVGMSLVPIPASRASLNDWLASHPRSEVYPP